MHMTFSNYIAFADESGSPVLDNPDPTFPIFVLSCVLVNKDGYAREIVPVLQKLKFDAVGHDQLILHERDIRRAKDDFAFLQIDPVRRAWFLEQINEAVRISHFDLIAAVIHKIRLAAKYADPWSPYQIALHFCMEMMLHRLLALGEAGKLIHVVFESRGKKEDAELELQFRRIASNQANWGHRDPDFSQLFWEPIFVGKRCNSSGLQLADLSARPLGLKVLRPLQPNQAFDVLRPKLLHGSMKSFP
ncbi:MAG: hypothetical protein JWM33_2518 [Caulobacteraceae bacterium]|nr:hypothetical protein [Caulobacteraceae bacterium]